MNSMQSKKERDFFSNFLGDFVYDVHDGTYDKWEKSFAYSYSHYVMLNLVCMEWTRQGTKKMGKELRNIKKS